MLPQNVGETDRAFRIVGGMLLLLYSIISLSGTPQLIAIIVALIAMVTGMVGFCALYGMMGMNTCPAKPVKKSPRKPVAKKAVAVAKKPVAKSRRKK
jgi:hypothetical protein